MAFNHSLPAAQGPAMTRASLELGSCGWARAPVRLLWGLPKECGSDARYSLLPMREILVDTDEIGSQRSLQFKVRGSASHHETHCALAQSGGTPPVQEALTVPRISIGAPSLGLPIGNLQCRQEHGKDP